MQIMATGDLQGNIDRVRSQLRSIGYPYPLDVQGLREGIPATILPLLHYALLGYSRHVARFLSSSGYELYAKSDLRFMECLLKFLRSEFGYRCPLTLAQIFSRGFSERKLLFLHDVIQACKRKHNELSKTSRLENLMRKAKTESSMLEGCMLSKENVCRHFKQKLDFPSESIGDALPKAISACREVSAPEMDTKNKAMIQQKESGTQGGNDFGSPKPRRDTEVAVGDCHRRVPLSNKLQYQKNTDNISAQMLEEERPSSGKVSGGCDPGSGLKSLQTVSLHQCYVEMKEKIVNIAEKIETRFSALEESVARTTETLEKKIVVLEGRMHHLEQTFTHQNIIEPPSQGLSMPFMDHHQQCLQSPKRYDAAGFNDTLTALKDYGDGFQNLSLQPNFSTGDISIIHQSGQRSLAGGCQDFDFAMTTDSAFKYQKLLSTQELIESVKARCNKTNELLNQDWHRLAFPC